MRYLLDTHVILWALENNSRLSKIAKHLIEDSDTECFVSMVSFFEIAIKKNIGKFETDKKISEFINQVKNIDIQILEISPNHLDEFEKLPLIEAHKDPFDRMIIATAIIDGLKIISVDEKFENYREQIEIIW
jgi:PIN domain nuclease of toxin-antitoxin system